MAGNGSGKDGQEGSVLTRIKNGTSPGGLAAEIPYQELRQRALPCVEGLPVELPQAIPCVARRTSMSCKAILLNRPPAEGLVSAETG